MNNSFALPGDVIISREQFVAQFPRAHAVLRDEVMAFVNGDGRETRDRHPDWTDDDFVSLFTEDYFYLINKNGEVEHHGHPSEPRRWDEAKGTWVQIPNRYNV